MLRRLRYPEGCPAGLQPGGILSLKVREFGDGIVPAAGTAAMTGGAAGADHRCAGGPRSTISRLAFSVRHGSFTNRPGRHGSTPKRYVTEPPSRGTRLRRGS